MATAFKTQFTKDIRDDIEHAQQFDAYFADIDVEEALNESVNYGSVYAEIYLFVFLTTNEDAISSNLYNEYRNEIRRRGNQLNSEIVAITTLIKKHKESQAELTRGQHEITQDMLDADALRAMPLIKPED